MRQSTRIRPATAADGPALRAIERASGERFREVGRHDVADDEPPSLEVLAGYAARGRSWVAVDEADVPLGYLVLDVLDGRAHLEQLSVQPEAQGRGLARALVEHAVAWAAAHGLGPPTLTTFRDVPWNAPLFARLGFRLLTDDELGPELRAQRMHEAERGLELTERVCMVWDQGPRRRR